MGKGSVTTHFVCRPIFETILRDLDSKNFSTSQMPNTSYDLLVHEKRCVYNLKTSKMLAQEFKRK